MKIHSYHLAWLLLIGIYAQTLQAQHVVWLDFGNFNLNSYTSVNGNNPPTNADVSTVQNLVIANMVEDLAPFDIQLTTFQPPNGRYTRVRILGANAGGLFGCAGPSCCANAGMCSGIDTWDTMAISGAEVYSGSFAGDTNFSGANATTARIANGISHTASHELGHVLGLFHANAADDSISLGCNDGTCPSQTADQNPTWHVMASGSSWSLTMPQRATRDRFFSIHASRQVLYTSFQGRSHWANLPDLSMDDWWPANLGYGRVQTPTTTAWFAQLSNGSQFDAPTNWSADAGNSGDIFLTGDVDGDQQDDLVYGRITGTNTTRWFVRLSNGSGFGNFTTWANDAGDAGDIFRLADVNGDRLADLVYGRALSSTQVRWYVRLSTGGEFAPFTTWSNDAGDEGDIFMLADVDADGDADLLYGRAVSATQVTWYVRRSNGLAFGAYEIWRNDAGDAGDLFAVGDDNLDGAADLYYGRFISDTQVTWFFRPSTGSSFGSFSTFRTDAGDAGDLFRLGDGDNDGLTDIFYGRPSGMTSLTTQPNLTQVTWFGRLSVGNGFGGFTTWNNDAGDEGDVFP
jgi:hypothetical protein